MNILITGANGFLGRSLRSSNILENHNLFFTTRKELDVLNRDEVFEYIHSNNIDVIIHTAVVGHPGKDSIQTLRCNLKSDLNILQAHRMVDKIIIFGSGAEYNTMLPIENVVETDEIKSPPIGYYGLGKYTISNAARCIPNVYNLRLFGCFGPEENDIRFIKANLNKYKNDEPMFITKDRFMDFIYIDDLLLLIECVINTNSRIKEINCIYEKKYKLSDIANIINNQNEHTVPIDVPKIAKGLNYTARANNISFFRLKLKGLEQGIKEMFNGKD